MRKTIFCFGCSFTNGVTESQNYWQKSYPALLSQFIDADVYNFGISGGNNILNDWLIKTTLLQYKVDFVFKQNTHKNRFYYSKEKDSEKIKLKYGVEKKSDNYYVLSKAYMNNYFKYFTPKESGKDVVNIYRRFPNLQIEHLNDAACLASAHRLKDTKHYEFKWDNNCSGNTENILHDILPLNQYKDSTGHMVARGNRLIANFLKEKIEYV